ncbi:MAG TPA: hypothetical protein VN372_03740 [Methanospirillum sp.]|nr:hypothetical protein [Methanospirillum sp.]
MRKLLKYKLTDHGTIPTFIENGGYFPTEDGYLHGISVSIDDEWTPDGTTWVSKAELEAIITATNTNLPEGMQPMTILNFEADKFMFRYKETTQDKQIQALQQWVMEKELE